MVLRYCDGPPLLTDEIVCLILRDADNTVCLTWTQEMAPTISNSAYAILRTLAARGPRVVTTTEIRESVGFDPHPMLGRDLVGRGWALPFDSPMLPQNRGVQITELGQAAFELGRLERREAAPEPVGHPVIRTGMARDIEWWNARMPEAPK
jgi:hypothetical protein